MFPTIGVKFALAALPVWLFPCNSLLATAPEGEDYAKATALCLSLIGLSIFIFSRLFEEMAVRVGLPPVLGDLVAGLVIGISGLHILVLEGGQINPYLLNSIQFFTNSNPEQIQEIFQGPIRIIVEEYAQFGVGILLFFIGLESELKELLKVGTQSAAVAVVGVTLPFVFGFLGLTYFFHVPPLAALFAGAALTATSIGITAKVLQDINVLKSQEGQIILGAAILDDILGIVILAVVISIVETGEIQVAKAASLIIIAAVFIIAAVLMNRFFGNWYVTQLEKLKAPSSVGMGAFILFIFVSFFSWFHWSRKYFGCICRRFNFGGNQISRRFDRWSEHSLPDFFNRFLCFHWSQNRS